MGTLVRAIQKAAQYAGQGLVVVTVLPIVAVLAVVQYVTMLVAFALQYATTPAKREGIREVARANTPWAQFEDVVGALVSR